MGEPRMLLTRSHDRLDSSEKSMAKILADMKVYMCCCFAASGDMTARNASVLMYTCTLILALRGNKEVKAAFCVDRPDSG